MKVAIVEGTPAEICEVLRSMRLDVDALAVIDQRLRPTPATAVFDAVCRVFDVHERTLTGPSRQRDNAYARHALCYLLRHDANLQASEIARLLHRDHSTVIQGIDRITWELVTRPETLRDIELCRTVLAARNEEGPA